MGELFAIMLIDPHKLMLSIYEITDTEWRLLHVFNRSLTTVPANAVEITGMLTEFLSMRPTQHIVEWRISSRGVGSETITAVSKATGFSIEVLLPTREQELLCKGMFTELW